MSFNLIKKAIEKGNELDSLLKQLQELHKKGIPLVKQREIAKNRADFELKKNNLIREMVKNEIDILKQ